MVCLLGGQYLGKKERNRSSQGRTVCLHFNRALTSTAWCSAGGALLYPASLSQKLQGLQEGYSAVRLLHTAGAGAEGADSWKLTAPTAGHRGCISPTLLCSSLNSGTTRWCFRMLVIDSPPPEVCLHNFQHQW